MLVLGIETSCDETSAAVVKDGSEVLSNVISSQIAIHQPFGGVVPEIASRKHLENILPVIEQALKEAGVSIGDIDLFAVTQGPGLVGALLIGVAAAKSISYALDKPLVAVNHLEGHIYANFLNEAPSLPLLCLVVSGGHTSLIYMGSHEKREMLGITRDDAAGEVFDKIARRLRIGYPGGPAIEEAALRGKPIIDFPRAWLEAGSKDFSFSGLKTAVINYINKYEQKNEKIPIEDIAASFQEAIFEVLVEKTIKAALEKGSKDLVLAGGVASNKYFRKKMLEQTKLHQIKLHYPDSILCTDNAAMIAAAGYFKYLKGESSCLDLNAVANLPLDV